MKRQIWFLSILMTVSWSLSFAVELNGFTTSLYWNEQVTTYTLYSDSVRVHINAPTAESYDATKPTRLIVFALPNGNSIEWTIGKKMAEGDNWHYDIQHIGAQIRRLREVVTNENIVVAYLEANPKSWPTWRKTHENSGKLIVDIIEGIKSRLPDNTKIFLTGHSGGGSLSFGFINEKNEIPAEIDRIAFLDSNYGFSANEGHGQKFIDWLKGDKKRHLIVIAYDDREITYNGKKVVSDTGGTWRATHRMVKDFEDKGVALERSEEGNLVTYVGMDRQITFILHKNPENKILHTVLVGEMNGLIYSATLDTPLEGVAGNFEMERAYVKWVQPN